MKKLIMIAALAVCAMGFSEVQAQKIIKDASGNVFMDVQDMPVGSFSPTTRNQIVSVKSAAHSVYKKLQIAKADLPTQMTWAEACGIATVYNDNTNSASGVQQGLLNTGCKTYSTEGNAGSWRVPTYKELVLMFILHDHLKAAGVTFGDNKYWAGTEEGTNFVMYVIFNSTQPNMYGLANSGSKTNLNSVRCVREVN